MNAAFEHAHLNLGALCHACACGACRGSGSRRYLKNLKNSCGEGKVLRVRILYTQVLKVIAFPG